MPRVLPPWAARYLKNTSFRLAEKLDTVGQIQAEAKAAGATLKNNGKGGLDPKLALAVFQRDKWTCQIPGCKTPKENLDLDHVAGHQKEIAQDPEADKWLKAQAKKPKSDDLDSLHVLCSRHHDLCHVREDALDAGKSPPPMTK
jgi:hypothetical protein